MLLRGGATGTIIAEVVSGRSVKHKTKSTRFSEWYESVVEFGLAEVTTVARVCRVARVLHLFGLDDLVSELEARGKLAGLLALVRGEAGRIACDAEGARAKLLRGDVGDV